jgi:hypothetical protein
MNILAPVRRDRVLAELPQVGTRATSGLWLSLSVGGEKVAQPRRPARPAAPGWSASHPTPSPGLLGYGTKAPFSQCSSQCLKKEAALHVRKDFHPRVTCACQEHRTGTVG